MSCGQISRARLRRRLLTGILLGLALAVLLGPGLHWWLVPVAPRPVLLYVEVWDASPQCWEAGAPAWLQRARWEEEQAPRCWRVPVEEDDTP